MSIKDQIRAEIERRMFEDYNGPNTEQNETAQGVCAGLLSFLDSLPEQPVEGLEEEYKDYVENDPVYSKLVNRNAGLDIARHFAEWGMNQGKEVKDAALKLCETVERYTNGAALRSELLNTVNATRLKMR